MSKLYDQYLNLKSSNEDQNILYLFKAGIFYICLENDAKKLSEIFDFKVTHLNEDVVKCGFPIKRLKYYTKLLEQMDIKFEIIDNEQKILSTEEYIDNKLIKTIIDDITNLDMEDISYKKAFEILYKMHSDLKKLEKETNNGK